jgi:DNA-binding MarR family transcriptional regulator
MSPSRRIQWMSDFIRLEIALWNRIDTALKRAHDLPLAFFESLFFIAQSRAGSLRIGDLARLLCISQGATSKLVDRIEQAGLLRREPDADDRRASRVVLTDTGRQTLAAASTTYAAELAALLDATLSTDEQQHLHDLVVRLGAALNEGDSA